MKAEEPDWAIFAALVILMLLVALSAFEKDLGSPQPDCEVMCANRGYEGGEPKGEACWCRDEGRVRIIPFHEER